MNESEIEVFVPSSRTAPKGGVTPRPVVAFVRAPTLKGEETTKKKQMDISGAHDLRRG